MDRLASEKESKAPLEGKTVLITGGGRGIGAAASKLLASRGANVIVNYLRNKESAERIVAEIKSSKETGQHTRGGCNCYSSRCKKCGSGSVHG